MFMFVGEVWSCHKNPIFEIAYYALAEELKDNLKLVTVDMAGYEQPARYWVENFTTRANKSEFDKAKDIWCYFFITFYHGEIIDQHQGKEFSRHRETAHKAIDKVLQVKRDFEISLWKEPEYITSSSWEIDLNKARKPIFLYFRTNINKEYCKLRETKACIKTISHEFKNDIDFYMLQDDRQITNHNFDFNLYQHFNISETPYILALNFNGSEWVEAGRIKPLPYEDRESQRFNYDEVHNFCVKLIKDSNKDLLETPELIELETKEKIEMILLETKKPVYIYIYNSEEDDFEKDNIQHALRIFRKLQIQYKNKITFGQIDSITCKHLYQPFGRQISNTFMGIFNDCIYGPVYCHQETGLTAEEVVEELEKIAKEMSEEEYLPIEGVLAYKKLDSWYNKPCFLAFYTSLEVGGMTKMKKFNSLYKQYKDKVDFLKVESTQAYVRHKLTRHDLPPGGCTRKEQEETYRKMVYSGYEGDLNDGMKVCKLLPTFVGYFQGTLFEKIGFSSYDGDAEVLPTKEVWDLMEKQVAMLSEIKPCTVPFVEEIEYLEKYYDQGKPILFFFHTDFTPEISNELERINSELEGKVTLIRITRGGQIYQDFDVLYTYPAFCAVWNREKIKKIDNSNQSDTTFNTFWAQSGQDINALLQKLKKLADKYPVQIQNKEEEEQPKENVVTPNQDEIAEKMTKLCLNFDVVSDMDESLVTHKGEFKKLLDFKASCNGVENMYLGVLYSGHRDIRLREKKVSATLYIKPYPQELLNFTNEKMYQIVLYEADAKYFYDVKYDFKSNESLLGVYNNILGFGPTTLYPWRIKKEGDDYVISNPFDKKVLCCWYFAEENIYQIYAANEGEVTDQIKVTWTFEKSEGKKLKEFIDSEGNLYAEEEDKKATYNSSVLDDL